MHWKTVALFVTMGVLAGSSFLAIAGDTKEKGPKGSKALQGAWSAAKGDKKFSLTFDGAKFTLDFAGKSISGTYTVDPSKKPKAIDMTVTKISDDEKKPYVGKTSLGIYELDGNKLKWCANEPGKDDRPTAFPGPDEKMSKMLYLVFEREKK